jgi:hypothetical protein
LIFPRYLAVPLYPLNECHFLKEYLNTTFLQLKSNWIQKYQGLLQKNRLVKQGQVSKVYRKSTHLSKAGKSYPSLLEEVLSAQD